MKSFRTHLPAHNRAPASRSALSAQFSLAKFVLVFSSACWLLSVSPANAIDTKFSALETVDSYGYGTYSTSTPPITLTGVVINNPYDMLNGNSEWQIFFQTLDTNDYGGTALYMRTTHPMTGAVLYDSTTSPTWTSELSRLMYSGTDGLALGYGDVIQVTAKAPGMFFGGKYNINEMHSSDPANDFSIAIQQRGATPAHAPITLDNLKDASNQFLFNVDRQLVNNCEHYQGSLVHLDNLILDSGAWAPDGTVVVKQLGQGDRTFDLKLGLDSDLFTSSIKSKAQSNLFSVTAILDQEDYGYTVTDPDSPDVGNTFFTGGYRLWLTNADQLQAVPEPSSLVLMAIGTLTGMLLWRRRSVR